eukprot:1153969-Pelagomonas_calceolata.AAC.4
MELALRSCDSAPRPPICSSVLASGACIGREALVPATLLPPICSCALVSGACMGRQAACWAALGGISDWRPCWTAFRAVKRVCAARVLPRCLVGRCVPSAAASAA